MSEISVSVVMPVYNCEKYLKKAIDSVLMQDVSLELILINDCTPDDSERVINKYLNDDRIVYLKNDYNIGVAGTRNKGVLKARGEYVAFLDSDDYWEQGKLKLQLECMKNSNAVLCSTARELIKSDGTATGRIISVDEKITYKRLLSTNVINCSSVLVKTDVIKKYPMCYDEAHEDYITWLKILKEYGDAVGIDKPLLNYRLSEAGKSRNKLKSATMHYKALRYVGFNRLTALYYFSKYAFNGVLKYTRRGKNNG